MIDLPNPPKKAPKKPEIEEVSMNREMTKDELKVVSQINALLKAGVSFPPTSKINYTPRRESGGIISGVSSLILKMKAQEKGFSSDLWLTKDEVTSLGGSVKDGEVSVTTPAVVRLKETDFSREDGFKIVKQTKSVELYNLEQCYNLPSTLWKPFLAKSLNKRSDILRDRIKVLSDKNGVNPQGSFQEQVTSLINGDDALPLSKALAVSEILQEHGANYKEELNLKKSLPFDVWTSIRKEASRMKRSFYFESEKLKDDLYAHVEIKIPLLTSATLEADYEPKSERVVLHKLSPGNDKDLARIRQKFASIGLDAHIEVAPDASLLMGKEIKTPQEQRFVTFMVANEHVFDAFKADTYVGEKSVSKADRIIPIFGGEGLNLSLRKGEDCKQVGVLVVNSGAPDEILQSIPNLVGRYNSYRDMMKNQEFYKATLSLNGDQIINEKGFSLSGAKLLLRSEALRTELLELDRFLEHNPLNIDQGKASWSYRFGDNQPLEVHEDQAINHSWVYLYGERVDEQTLRLLDRALKDHPYMTIIVDSEIVAERLLEKGFYLEGDPTLDRSDVRGTLKLTETLVLRNEPPLMKQWEALDDALDLEDADLNQLALSLSPSFS